MLKKAGRRDRQSDEWSCISAHQLGEKKGGMERCRMKEGWRVEEIGWWKNSQSRGGQNKMLKFRVRGKKDVRMDRGRGG